MNKFKLAALSVALCLGVATSAIGATMTKAEYEAAEDRISATYKADKTACDQMSGNAKDVCIEEAKGKESVAKAELEARYKPTATSQRDVAIAKAKATHAVAKEKCDDFAGNAKDVCVKEAQAALVTAEENAKLNQKTGEANATAREKSGDANAAANEKKAEARKDAAEEKREANYETAKEKCDALAGDAKDNCIKDAKARYAQ